MGGRGGQDARAMARQAMQSLRDGNAAAARALDEALAAAGVDDAAACLGLALACRALGDGDEHPDDEGPSAARLQG